MAREQKRQAKPKRGQKSPVLLLLLLAAAAVLLLEYSGLGNRYPGYIPPYVSAVDKDGDGIDDQTDILQNARSYVATRPKYKSKYYVGGYPDDEYGVCTDVVAQALLGSGYDLMTLVGADIQAHSDRYHIDKPDPNIDFRRVRNLNVYFSRTAISLTTDVYDLERWQGGDIVIFRGHIGIVSDKRNRHGVPYLIHHGSPDQKSYEQDVLEHRDDIIAHYRIS